MPSAAPTLVFVGVLFPPYCSASVATSSRQKAGVRDLATPDRVKIGRRCHDRASDGPLAGSLWCLLQIGWIAREAREEAKAR